MSTYEAELPKVFQLRVSSSPEDICRWVEYLLDGDCGGSRDLETGSSFAVTVGNLDGTWNLWMSHTTFNRLAREYTSDPVFIELEKQLLELFATELQGSRPDYLEVRRHPKGSNEDAVLRGVWFSGEFHYKWGGQDE